MFECGAQGPDLHGRVLVRNRRQWERRNEPSRWRGAKRWHSRKDRKDHKVLVSRGPEYNVRMQYMVHGPGWWGALTSWGRRDWRTEVGPTRGGHRDMRIFQLCRETSCLHTPAECRTPKIADPPDAYPGPTLARNRV